MQTVDLVSQHLDARWAEKWMFRQRKIMFESGGGDRGCFLSAFLLTYCISNLLCNHLIHSVAQNGLNGRFHQPPED